VWNENAPPEVESGGACVGRCAGEDSALAEGGMPKRSRRAAHAPEGLDSGVEDGVDCEESWCFLPAVETR
jgi:hypothetical protein